MVYFEELRLLILLVMAYLSYRKISNSALQAIEQYGGAIEDEEEVDGENQQLEEEAHPQQPEGVVDSEGPAEGVVEELCQQAEPIVPLPSCLPSTPSDELVPEPEVPTSDANVLGEVDENEPAAKVGKRKMIKKTWRREKKESVSETIIGSEEQVESQVEVDVEGVKENEMIDI